MAEDWTKLGSYGTVRPGLKFTDALRCSAAVIAWAFHLGDPQPDHWADTQSGVYKANIGKDGEW